MKLKRANTLFLLDRKEEKDEDENENLKLKKKIVKSISVKNLVYSMNSILNHYSEKKLKFPKILSSDDLISNIRERILKNKNLSFFISDENGIRINKTDNRVINYRRRAYLKKASHFNEFLNYNVFNEKDEEIKDIIDKFNIQNAKQKINKVKRRKIILNKLYGITPEYNNKIKTAKSQKHLSLVNYQDNIIDALNSNGMYSTETIGKLYQKFKNIKIDVDNVVPYPKINIKKIIKHFKKGIKKNNRVFSLKEFLSKSNEPEDEFEKEEKKIIALKLKKNTINRNFRIQNDNLYMLPSHVRKLFRK